MKITVKQDKFKPITELSWKGNFYLSVSVGEIVSFMTKDHLSAHTWSWREENNDALLADLTQRKLVKRLCKELQVTPENLAPTLREIMTKAFPKPIYRYIGRGTWEPIR